jgi:hypothetical protein
MAKCHPPRTPGPASGHLMRLVRAVQRRAGEVGDLGIPGVDGHDPPHVKPPRDIQARFSKQPGHAIARTDERDLAAVRIGDRADERIEVASPGRRARLLSRSPSSCHTEGRASQSSAFDSRTGNPGAMGRLESSGPNATTTARAAGPSWTETSGVPRSDTAIGTGAGDG